jgi:hypothetical protein
VLVETSIEWHVDEVHGRLRGQIPCGNYLGAFYKHRFHEAHISEIPS